MKNKSILKKYTFALDANYIFSAGIQQGTVLASYGRYIACLTLLSEERSRRGRFTIYHNDTSVLLYYISTIVTYRTGVSKRDRVVRIQFVNISN